MTSTEELKGGCCCERKNPVWQTANLCKHLCKILHRSKLKWLLIRCLVDTMEFEMQNFTIPRQGNWGRVINFTKVAKQVNGQRVTILAHGPCIHSETMNSLSCHCAVPVHKFCEVWAAVNKLGKVEGTEVDVLAEFFSCPLLRISAIKTSPWALWCVF